MADAVRVQPVVGWPREAEQGRTYLLSVDLRLSGDVWPYEREEYPVFCMLSADPACEVGPVGEPAVLLHRFGGTYGPARFLLRAGEVVDDPRLMLTLVNESGLPVGRLPLPMRVVEPGEGNAPQEEVLRVEGPAAETPTAREPTVDPEPRGEPEPSEPRGPDVSHVEDVLLGSREVLVQELVAWLRGYEVEGSPLILTGMAGSGKTVVMQRVARAMGAAAVLVSASGADLGGVANAVGLALGLENAAPMEAAGELGSTRDLALLVDALDESREPAAIADWIATLAVAYQTRVLVATRRRDLPALRGRTVELESASEEDVAEFARSRGVTDPDAIEVARVATPNFVVARRACDLLLPYAGSRERPDPRRAAAAAWVDFATDEMIGLDAAGIEFGFRAAANAHPAAGVELARRLTRREVASASEPLLERLARDSVIGADLALGILAEARQDREEAFRQFRRVIDYDDDEAFSLAIISIAPALPPELGVAALRRLRAVEPEPARLRATTDFLLRVVGPAREAVEDFAAELRDPAFELAAALDRRSHGFPGEAEGSIRREWLFERVDEFERERPGSPMVVEFEPGVGRTRFAATLAERSGGPAFVFGPHVDVEDCARHLCAQLVLFYDLPLRPMPDDEHGLIRLLGVLLEEAGTRQPVRIVITGPSEDLQTLQYVWLPPSLPDRVSVVLVGTLRSRPADITVRRDDPLHLADLAAYARSRMATEGIDFDDAVVDMLVARSDGRWRQLDEEISILFADEPMTEAPTSTEEPGTPADPALFPMDLRYHPEHDWVRLDGDIATFGITSYAQKQLADVVFADLPNVAEAVTAGEAYGELESVKAVIELYAPMSGEVVAVNEELGSAPELINEDPYGRGWIVRVRVSEPAEYNRLLDAVAYEQLVEEESR